MGEVITRSRDRYLLSILLFYKELTCKSITFFHSISQNITHKHLGL